MNTASRQCGDFFIITLVLIMFTQGNCCLIIDLHCNLFAEVGLLVIFGKIMHNEFCYINLHAL